VKSDGVVALELTAGLTEKGTATLFEVLSRHLHLEPKEGELILASLLRSKFDQYLAALDEIRLMDPEQTALAEFQRQGKTLQQRLLGTGDREQDSIKILAAFLNAMYRTWAEASEGEREEMMCEFAALLQTDPVLKQVGIGYLAFIVAGEQGTKPSELYRLTLRDGTLEKDNQIDEGAYDVAHRIDDASQLSQRGHQSALDLFLRWAPRAQPVLEDTSPSFEVTRQIGPSESTSTVPVPMNLIPLAPPGRP
jgi:hypothetical protein